MFNPWQLHRICYRVDVLAAINVSDLWQSNRASQISHILAFNLLISTPAEHFSSSQMTSFEDFKRFCIKLIDALPAFPMLEDYVPEADWGEARVLIGGEPVLILHGGLVQRIFDFIEAFRISHSENSDAISDMEHAIRLQDELLNKLPFNYEAENDNARPGYIEVPPERFWKMCVPALNNLSWKEKIRNRYVATLGQSVNWNNASDFGDAVMNGSALPWQAVSIQENIHAISLRNSTSVVIDTWVKSGKIKLEKVASELGVFLKKRVRKTSCIAGPVFVRSSQRHVRKAIAAVLIDEEHCYLIVPMSIESLAELHKTVTDIRRVMRDSDWGFQFIENYSGFKLQNSQGKNRGAEGIELIFVDPQVSTELKLIECGSVKVRQMSLVDACTIFDSIESVEELARFWKYVDNLEQFGGGMFNDLGDLFSSFRDVQAQIIEGAVIPNFVSLDPHWGASWRYTQLKNFWKQSPAILPDEDSAWTVSESKGLSSLTRAIAKNLHKLAWSSTIGSTTIHFILDVDAVGLNPKDGELLELFVHCAADSIAQRESLIKKFLTLPYTRINLHCFSSEELLATTKKDDIKRAQSQPVVTAWSEVPSKDSFSYQAKIIVNLAKLAEELEGAKDASFEVSCAIEVVEYLFKLSNQTMPSELHDTLVQTKTRRPRFHFKKVERNVDVPDFTQPQIPSLEDYKVARRELACTLKSEGVEPGTYKLQEAKELINRARIAFRNLVHKQIQNLDRESLIRHCVKQYDALTAAYNREEFRLKHSMEHEVDYDRQLSMTEVHQKFIREGRNYRYILESATVLNTPQTSKACKKTVLSILAMVDWLFVLYGANDVLHYGIDVGGLKLDEQYVPEVFYSEARNQQEELFGREMANLRLGVNVLKSDKVATELTPEQFISNLDVAFSKDLGFSYSNLLEILGTLIQWVSVGGGEALACGYVGDKQEIADTAVEAFEDLSKDAALAVIDFLVLEPAQAWRLIGKDEFEADVPVWEHSKRGSRYNIRPLIELSDGKVTWGAALVERTRRIWSGAIADGYLPADFPWPNVKKAVGKIKKQLEVGLEERAYEVCARKMPYAINGIDFKSRFPKQGFADVGDFDVLAYRPEKNLWLTVECKYNKPAFCLKDTRRLRDEIFGKSEGKRGQIGKIERRRNFLVDNVNTLRSLLGWPEPAANKSFSLVELYVSKDTHFWLRFPPYEVPTYFVQIDTLDAWLESDAAPYGIVD